MKSQSRRDFLIATGAIAVTGAIVRTARFESISTACYSHKGKEEILKQKLKCLSLELQPGNPPGTYTIAHPHPPQPPYLNGWRDLSLDQVEDATSDIEVGQDPRFGCGTLRAVTVGKPWRHGLPECYVERLDAPKTYRAELRGMRYDLATIREGLSSPEAQRLIDERPSLSALSKDITAAIVLLECAEAKLFNLLPIEETMSPGDVAP
jgi:hypothetical protein